MVFGCWERTIQRTRKQEASGVQAAYEQGQSKTNLGLRKRLLERALGGNPCLLWNLCVARLGFVDTPGCAIKKLRDRLQSSLKPVRMGPGIEAFDANA